MIEKTLILTKKKAKNLGQEGILIGKEGNIDNTKDQGQTTNYLYPRQEVKEDPRAHKGEIADIVAPEEEEQLRGKGNRVDMVSMEEFRVEDNLGTRVKEVSAPRHLSENLLSAPLKEHTHEGETSNLVSLIEISV